LTLDTNKIDLGQIAIGKVPQLPAIKAKLDQVATIQGKMQRIRNEGIKNPEDADELLSLLNQQKAIQDELQAMTITLDPSTGQPLPVPASLTLSTDPEMHLEGEIHVVDVPQKVRARPGKSPTSLGDLTSNIGTTVFTAQFTPNGNYGFVTFQGSADGTLSKTVVLEITGECRAMAQARLNAALADLLSAAAKANAVAGRTVILAFGLIVVAIAAAVPGVIPLAHFFPYTCRYSASQRCHV
jgi:hypothetical protein